MRASILVFFYQQKLVGYVPISVYTGNDDGCNLHDVTATVFSHFKNRKVSVH